MLQLDVTKVLLSYKPDLSIQDNDGWTALMYAADEGSPEIVALLLEGGASLNQTKTDGVWRSSPSPLSSWRASLQLMDH